MRVWGQILLILAVCVAEMVWPGSIWAKTLRQGGIPLNYGEAVTGSLDDELFRQVYVFTGQAEEVVAINMERIEGDLDPYLLLTDEQGSILAVSDDDGSGADARIEVEHLPAMGRYFVIATRYGQEHGNTRGDYQLLLEQIGTSIASASSTLQYGDSVLGRISAEQPLMFYFVRAQRGEVINVLMRRTSGNLDPRLDLATPDGLVLVSNDDDPQAEGTLDAGIREYTILRTGLYLIVATRFGDQAGDTEGSFVVSVTQISPEDLGASPEQARLLDYGMSLEGALDTDVPVRYYRFDAQRGDVITATLASRSGALDPLLKLTDANLSELARDDDGSGGVDARIAAFTLPSSGTYYLLATHTEKRGGQRTGGFALQLTGRAGIVGGRALEIVYGATVSGLIDSSNDAEEYVFFGQQGDVIRISMERASGDLDSLVTLYDSERKQIAFDDDGGSDQDALIQQFVLPRDDMYILVASRYDRDAGTTSGAYFLILELVRSGS